MRASSSLTALISSWTARAGAASGAVSSLAAGADPTRKLARILARAPMMPTPTNYEHGGDPPPKCHRIVVAIAHRGDGDDRIPERVPTRGNVRCRRRAFELEHEHTGNRQDQDRQKDGNERRVLAAVIQDVPDQRPPLFSAQPSSNSYQPAQTGQTQEDTDAESRMLAMSRADRASPAGRSSNRISCLLHAG